MVISLIGIILNSTSTFILTFSKNSSTKFLKFLKFYSFNSLAISLNDFLFFITCFKFVNIFYIRDKTVYIENKIMQEIALIYLNIWTFLYTFSGILDIFIVYERIQIYLVHSKFLRNKSAEFLSFCVLLYSVLINVPVGIARKSNHDIIVVEAMEPINVYSFGLWKIYQNEIFLLSVLLSNFVRDIFSFVTEIILNAVLMVTMNRHYKARMTLNVQTLAMSAFRRTDINNSEIALFMNFTSALFHMITFSIFILFKYSSYDTWNSVYYFYSNIFTSKYFEFFHFS